MKVGINIATIYNRNGNLFTIYSYCGLYILIVKKGEEMLKLNILKQIENYMDDAIAIRREIHRHPELSMKEFNTTRIITQALERYGIEIEDKGLETGVCAIIRTDRPGKTVALRADIDALPIIEQTGLEFSSEIEGISHMCGHDLHTALMILCARVINENKDQLSGSIKIVFQPAEEGLGGAKYMISKNVMANPKPDVIIGAHVGGNCQLGKIMVLKGHANSASDKIEITVKGVGGHGAHPYNCIDPILTSALLIAQLRTLINSEVPATEPAVLSFGMISGGTAANIIPSEVTITGTLRTFTEKTREKLHNSIERTATFLCKSMDAQALVKITKGPRPLFHDHKVADDIIKVAKKTIGSDNVVTTGSPSPGSDDFSEFLEFCPGVRFRVGTGIEGKEQTLLGNHNPRVIFDERSLNVAAPVICQYVIDYLTRE